ncbi:MAG: hypothetical protein PHW13_09450 [Methylococcales bacterium]|nr:hypothetical protein [Methylococcales bacterium]
MSGNRQAGLPAENLLETWCFEATAPLLSSPPAATVNVPPLLTIMCSNP